MTIAPMSPKPLTPPALRATPVAVAVAEVVSTKVVPLTSMLAMLAPGGIPAPLTPIPTVRFAVLATVTVLEPAVVAPAVRSRGAVSVSVVLPLAVEPATEIAGREIRPESR